MDASTQDIHELSSLLDAIEQNQEILRTLNKKVLDEIPEEMIKEEIIQSDKYSLVLSTKIRRFRSLVETQSYNDRIPDSCANTCNSNHHNAVVSQAAFSNVQLPELTLPTFHGDILTWQTFWDSFEAAVHHNPTLTDIKKFTYLKAQLADEALRSIEGLSLTNSNYKVAVELLTERYGQPHRIINFYMQALLEMKAPENNLKSLRFYYDKLEALIRGLDALGQSGDSYGTLLIPIVLRKLPSELRINLVRENGTDKWNLNALRDGILKELQIMEACQPISICNAS